ncbi:MAG: DUF2269 domain-containing protein [Bacteroidetes bacterium]|jgi:uncharacterized membrane protein|nr:DUF2269 domain-containing protein [Bacteroidota bacterium]
MSYQLLKLIHIVSATLMIGTGLGSAFYLFLTYKRSSVTTVKEVLKLVILADTIFTTPSVIIQLITGVLLSNLMGLTYSNWFWVVFSVSFIVLVLWLRAAFIQLKLKKILENENEIPEQFHRLMKIWFYLGIPSFLGSVFIYYLMVYKPFI